MNKLKKLRVCAGDHESPVTHHFCELLNSSFCLLPFCDPCDLRQRATQNCDRQNSEICFEHDSLRSLRSKLYRSADAETRCPEISLVNCTVADTFAGLINLFGRMALRSTFGSLLESIVASGISL